MRAGPAERRRQPEGRPGAGEHWVRQGPWQPPPPTYTGPTEGVRLEASFAVTAVGTREVVAHLALPAVVCTRLALIHICQGR